MNNQKPRLLCEDVLFIPDVNEETARRSLEAFVKGDWKTPEQILEEMRLAGIVSNE